MLTLIGYSLIGTSIVLGSYPAFESVFLKSRYNMRKLKENLNEAFINAELCKLRGNMKISPNILKTEVNRACLTFVFSIPKGLSPDKVKDSLFVFKQHFSEFVTLEVTEKRGILKIYPKGLPNEIKYNYDQLNDDSLNKMRIPILCGRNLEGNTFMFDMVKYPHILIAGETGSGKSSEIRSMLTTLIKSKSPNQLKLILGDLKRSEFHLFKRIEHVEGVYHSADELRPALKKVKREMTKRGDILDKEEVNSVDELEKKPPYIVVCIDEVVLLKKETDIMDILEEISSIGRSLGVFLVLSMQRPDSKLLDGKLKVNLTVRMGFKTADSTNSKVIGTPGSEKINTPGRMILKVNSELQEIQSFWLDNDKAKSLLESYKKDTTNDIVQPQDEYSKVRELFFNE